MHRLFIGIDPPDAIKDFLLAAMGGIAGARWQTRAQLHLTVRFIGEVDGRTADAVADCLRSVRAGRFAVAVEGVGLFERRGRADALWAGVRPHEPLKVLHNKVDQVLLRVGMTADSRAYLPHITLARFGRDAGSLGGFMAARGGLASAPFMVDALCLYESQLTRDGSVYAIVERYALAESDASSPRTPAATSA